MCKINLIKLELSNHCHGEAWCYKFISWILFNREQCKPLNLLYFDVRLWRQLSNNFIVYCPTWCPNLKHFYYLAIHIFTYHTRVKWSDLMKDNVYVKDGLIGQCFDQCESENHCLFTCPRPRQIFLRHSVACQLFQHEF